MPAVLQRCVAGPLKPEDKTLKSPDKRNKKFRSGYVALLGKPNVGKSTLLNNLLKEKLSIISEKPQTTRNAIIGIFSGDDFQVIFIDTPGLHKPRTPLGEHMQKSALAAGVDADIVIGIPDTGENYPGGF